MLREKHLTQLYINHTTQHNIKKEQTNNKQTRLYVICNIYYYYIRFYTNFNDRIYTSS